MKNYIGFSKDASGSMHSLANSAIKDYNANISAVKDAATENMLDTIVFANRFSSSVTREVINSNPHVLKPLTSWTAGGFTALYDGIGDLITQMEAVPDAADKDVSFLIMATTDGGENDSRKWNLSTLKRKIAELQHTDRWTFVVRVPKGQRSQVSDLGIPAGNIQEWDTTAQGIEASTATTTQAMRSFYASKAAGQNSSNVFYTSTAAVDTTKLVAMDKSLYSLYTVDTYHDGAQIKDFILSKRSEYMIGGAFYQLTKTEARVSPTKLILIRDRASGDVFQGADARKMLGLDTVNNARVHPNHGGGGFDIFIQSESVNRKLVANTGVLYMPSIGRKMTQADLDKYSAQAPKVPAVVALPEAPATGKPTASPLKPVAKAPVAVSVPKAMVPTDGGRVRYHAAPNGAAFYPNREVARHCAAQQGMKAYDAGPSAAKGFRHYVA